MPTLRKKTKSKRRLSSTIKSNEPPQHLQSEYINNLQQQVYFLELELQIMKEKATTGQFGGRSSISKTAPIDTHVNSLRDKYTYMEKKFKKKMKSLEESVVDLTGERDVLKMQLERAESDVRDMKEQLDYYKQIEDQLRSEHLDVKLVLEQKLEKAENGKAEKDQLYLEKRKEYEELRLSSRKKDLENQEKILELKHQCEREQKSAQKSEEKAKDSEQGRLEAEEQIVLKDKQINEYRKGESKLQDEIAHKENQLKKCQMDLDLCKTHSEKFENQCTQLKSELEEVQSQLRVIKQMENDAEASETRWSGKIVNLTSEVGVLKTKLQYASEDVERHKSEKVDLREELTRTRERVRDCEEKIETLEADIQSSIKKIENLEGVNLQREKDHIISSENEQKAVEDQKKVEAQLAEVQNELDELRAKHKTLESQLATQNALENINVEEVTRLSAASQDINSSIQALLATIQHQPPGRDDG